MREIMFRAWDKDEKIIREISSINFHGEEIEFYDHEGDWVGFDHIEIMQFTGLYDKTGKEIYEFDRITADESVWHGKIEGVIMWDDKGCRFRVIDEVTEDGVCLDFCSNIEVTGHYFEVKL